jgi:hypothetical protein
MISGKGSMLGFISSSSSSGSSTGGSTATTASAWSGLFSAGASPSAGLTSRLPSAGGFSPSATTGGFYSF